MVSTTLDQINVSLQKLRTIDLGYPQGKNTILPPDRPDVVEESLVRIGMQHHEELREFFKACDGLWLPDIYVGYFLSGAKSLVPPGKEYEVVEVIGSSAGEVVVLGSSGGGDLFALRRRENDILLLPPGFISDGVYDNTDSRGTVVANRFGSFLERVAIDVRAFVDDSPDHDFILRR